MRTLAAIVAYARASRAIGRGGRLPWHHADDLRYFRATTMHHAVVMGRKTYESIGRPLPGRRMIVVSRSAEWRAAHTEVECFATVVDALAAAYQSDAMPFVIGGAQLYAATLERCTHVFITEVDEPVADGDAFFPPLDESLFDESEGAPPVGVLRFRVLVRRGCVAEPRACAPEQT